MSLARTDDALRNVGVMIRALGFADIELAFQPIGHLMTQSKGGSLTRLEQTGPTLNKRVDEGSVRKLNATNKREMRPEQMTTTWTELGKNVQLGVHPSSCRNSWKS